jgi:hypothetical protein
MKRLLKDMDRRPCHDCNCQVGEIHVLGCDMERCPKCGGQLIGCGCFSERDWDTADANDDTQCSSIGIYAREKWSGIPYEAEHKYCEEKNLWVYWQPHPDGIHGKWIKCDKDHPEAIHDINSAIRLNHQK